MKHIPLVGYHFIVIYLELCALATENGGILVVPKIGEVPYVSMLAKDIGEDVELVGQAFTYFLNNSLVEKIEGDYEIQLKFNHVINNTGSSSNRADKLRLEYHQHKMLENNDKKESKNIKVYGLMGNVNLSDEEYRELYITISDLDEIIKELDISKAMGKETNQSDFEEIKKIAKRWGR